MLNKHSDGKTIRYTNAGETTIKAGSIVSLAGKFGVVISDIGAGKVGLLDIGGGVYTFKTAMTATKAQGSAVYIPAANSGISAGTDLVFSADSSAVLCGYLYEVATDGDASIKVLID